MSASTERLPRLLSLVPYLQTHPGMRVDEVAAVFDVSERQLRDDLNLLWVCGLPGMSPGDLIDLSFDGDHVTLLDAQTLDRPLRLTADEATALLVAARALADVPGLSERDALDRALAKLEAAAPAPARVDVALEPVDRSLSLAREALDSGRRVHLTYLVEARDEVTERDVDPLRVLVRDGRWYLEGYCHRAEAVRLFRLDRIREIVVLDQLAEPPPDIESRDLSDGLFQPSPDDLKVVLDLSAPARWVADHYPVESVSEQPDGQLRMVLRTPDPGWLVRLLLELGPAVTVVDPPDVREEVRRVAARALAAYLPESSGRVKGTSRQTGAADE
jgi:proteasome accessory factor C